MLLRCDRAKVGESKVWTQQRVSDYVSIYTTQITSPLPWPGKRQGQRPPEVKEAYKENAQEQQQHLTSKQKVTLQHDQPALTL